MALCLGAVLLAACSSRTGGGAATAGGGDAGDGGGSGGGGSGGGGDGDGGGDGGGTGVTAPAAPSNVAVVAGDEQTTLSWDAVSGADSYNVYWKVGPGVTLADTRIAGATSAHAHTGLTNGLTYHYAVTAVNSAGESALSAEASARPRMPAGTFTRTVELPGTVHTSEIGSSVAGRYMLLYRAEEVGGSGLIDSFSLRRSVAMSADAVCSGLTIRMGHSSRTELDTTYGANVQQGKGALETVLDGATVTIPAGPAGEFFALPMTTPFSYNGFDSLVVEIVRPTACSRPLGLRVHETGPWYASAVLNSTSSTADAGTASYVVLDTRLHFTGGETVAVDASGSSNYFPWNDGPSGRKLQLLYRADEIAGAGRITGLGFPMGATSVAAAYTVDVRLGHTSRAALASTFADNFDVGAPVAMAEALSFAVPAGVPAGSFVWIPLPEATFDYDGSSNLVVELQVTSASARNYWRIAGSGGSRVYAGAGAATGTVDEARYGMKFRFAGATVDVLSDGAEGDPRFFPAGEASGIVTLYRSSELGARGLVTSVACRSSLGTAAGSYPSFRVILAHTAADVLTTTAAFADPATVFDGAFSIPEGLQRGDWIEIPLSQPFLYDGARNLVVWMGTTAADGTGVNGCTASDTDATRYPDQAAIGAPGTSFSALSDLKPDLRLELWR